MLWNVWWCIWKLLQQWQASIELLAGLVVCLEFVMVRDCIPSCHWQTKNTCLEYEIYHNCRNTSVHECILYSVRILWTNQGKYGIHPRERCFHAISMVILELLLDNWIHVEVTQIQKILFTIRKEESVTKLVNLTHRHWFTKTFRYPKRGPRRGRWLIEQLWKAIRRN